MDLKGRDENARHRSLQKVLSYGEGGGYADRSGQNSELNSEQNL